MQGSTSTPLLQFPSEKTGDLGYEKHFHGASCSTATQWNKKNFEGDQHVVVASLGMLCLTTGHLGLVIFHSSFWTKELLLMKGAD